MRFVLTWSAVKWDSAEVLGLALLLENERNLGLFNCSPCGRALVLCCIGYGILLCVVSSFGKVRIFHCSGSRVLGGRTAGWSVSGQQGGWCVVRDSDLELRGIGEVCVVSEGGISGQHGPQSALG